EGLAYREQHSGVYRAADVAAEAEQVLEWLKSHPAVGRAEAAGSYRPGKEIVRDLDFVVSSRHGEAVLADFVRQPFAATVLAQGATKASIRLPSGCQCDVRAVSAAEYPFALAYFTGSKEHNVALRSRAL